MNINKIGSLLFGLLPLSVSAYTYETGTGDVSAITISSADVSEGNVHTVEAMGITVTSIDFDCSAWVMVDLVIGIDTDISIAWVVGFSNWLDVYEQYGADSANPVNDQYHMGSTFSFPGDDDPDCTIEVEAEVPNGTVYVRCVGTVYVEAVSAWTSGSAWCYETSPSFLVNIN